jgi:hypothetical protein
MGKETGSFPSAAETVRVWLEHGRASFGNTIPTAALDEVVRFAVQKWEALNAPPALKFKPVTECIALFNVSIENRVAIYASGVLSAREYDAVIRMMELDRETMRVAEAAIAEARLAEGRGS